jgi:fatty acid desaturase
MNVHADESPIREAPTPEGRNGARKRIATPPALRDRIRALSVPDGRLHLLYGLPYIMSYFACMAFILVSEEPLWLWLCGIIMGNQLYLLFILHHDCVHFGAFRSRRLNVLMGRLYALFLVKTFTATYETHKRHHSDLGRPERDPDEYFFAGGIRWVWFRYWTNFTRHTYLALTQYGPKVRDTVLIEQLVNILFWVAVHLALFGMGMGEKALFIFWVPVLTITLIVGPVTRAYEHLPLVFYKPDDPRRLDPAYNSVTVSSWLLGIFWAGVTYHVEHHAYPRVPFYRLRRLHLLLQQHSVPYLTSPYTLYGITKGPDVILLLQENGGAYGQAR